MGQQLQWKHDSYLCGDETNFPVDMIQFVQLFFCHVQHHVDPNKLDVGSLSLS